MCGIIAGIYENIYCTLLDGLIQLQNRGYDSAGIAMFDKITNEIVVFKKASNEITALQYLKSLYKCIDENKNLDKYLGIGHTRWATHGAKTDENAHPHISNSGAFVLVHNGIIENFKELRMILINNGYKMYSETDSEVVVNLIEYKYKNCKSVKQAIKETISMLKGTWGFVIASNYSPNTLFCSRFGSPLLVGYSDNNAIVTSEQSGFCDRIKNYFVLNNNDVCIIEKKDDGFISVETEKKYVNYSLKQSESDLSYAPYNHWMEKEIYEQCESIKRVIKLGSRLLNDGVRLGGFIDHKERLQSMKHVILLGCGTSLNAAYFAQDFFKRLTGFVSVQVIDGADFNIYDIPRGSENANKTCLILCSQSGETKDLHRCLKLVKESNYDIFTIGIVNVVNSLISREVDCGCYLHAGREVGVASTKSFTSQCVLLVLVSLWFSYTKLPNKYCKVRRNILNDIRQLGNNMDELLQNNGLQNELREKIIPFFVSNKNQDNSDSQSLIRSCFVLGKGRGEAVANEAALKIKEISYIHAEGYSTSSLKHGPFALLEPGFPVILLWMKGTNYLKTMNAYEEIKSRHALIIIITDDISLLQSSEYENVILIPENDTFSHMLAIVPLQILAYELSISKGYNPDMPRNLAKVVTVE